MFGNRFCDFVPVMGICLGFGHKIKLFVLKIQKLFDHRSGWTVEEVCTTGKVHDHTEDEEESKGSSEERTCLHLQKYVYEYIKESDCTCEDQSELRLEETVEICSEGSCCHNSCNGI